MDDTCRRVFFDGHYFDPGPLASPVSAGDGGGQTQGGKERRTGSASKAGVKRKRPPPDPSDPLATGPCTECGRRFWSQKALFGHMRCHPERRWRGITPPPHLRRPPPGETRPTTRPAMGARPRVGARRRQFDDVEREVAACLLLLAGGRTPAAAASARVAAGKRSTAGNSTAIDGACGLQTAAEGMIMMKCRGRRRETTSGGSSSSSHRRPGERRVVDEAASPSSAKGCIPDLNLPPPEGAAALHDNL